MPALIDVVDVLKTYRASYGALDAFIDDIAEFADGKVPAGFMVTSQTPFVMNGSAGGRTLRAEVRSNGVVRFQLVGGATPGASAAAGAAAGGLLGTALGAATETKGGMLAGLTLGLLIGGAVGSAVGAPQLPGGVLTLRFDPALMQWRVYDGPLVPWAKQLLAAS